MLKSRVVILALALVQICIAESGASHNGNGELDADILITGSTEGQVVHRNHKDQEKYHKKKYFKEVAEKKFHNEKDIAEHKKWHDKKFKDSESRFINQNEFASFNKDSKFSKYDNGQQNQLENNPKHKGVNYHDKNYESQKKKDQRRKYTEQEIVEDVKPVSLHHDIDVNYLPPKKDVSTDAEFINVNGHLKKDKGESNEVNGKKEKLNFYRNLREIDLTSIPPSNNSALMARYIIHNVDWTAIGTLSANSKMKGGPFVNVVSMSDGPKEKGSGVPFFFLTPKDFTSIDLNKDSRSSITATLAQTSFCTGKDIDPESPICSRVILFGKVKKVKVGTEEEAFAKNALFSRHPEMEKWPSDHEWYFAKLKIKQVIVLDHFGGPTYVSLHDYFSAGESKY